MKASTVRSTSTSTSTSQPQNCPECGAKVGCQVAEGKEYCWCFELPSSPGTPGDLSSVSCLCPDCLKKRKRREGVL